MSTVQVAYISLVMLANYIIIVALVHIQVMVNQYALHAGNSLLVLITSITNINIAQGPIQVMVNHNVHHAGNSHITTVV